MGAMGSNKARHNFQEETNRYFLKRGRKHATGYAIKSISESPYWDWRIGARFLYLFLYDFIV